MTKRMVRHGEPLDYLLAALTRLPVECTVWPYNRRAGYGWMRLDGPDRAVHDVVCEWYHGEKPSPDMQVRHLCGRGHLGCFTPIHLRWGTAADNAADREAGLLHNRGEGNANARITAAQAAEIRARYVRQPGKKYGRPSQQELADEYGITQSMVSQIILGHFWVTE